MMTSAIGSCFHVDVCVCFSEASREAGEEGRLSVVREFEVTLDDESNIPSE